MSKECRFKAVIIPSSLLIVTLLLNGCIGMTYAKKTESEGLARIKYLRKYFPLESSYYPEPAASKIGKHIKSTATPEEWEAIQCLGGTTLDSVKLMNSIEGCQDCLGAYTLTQTFQSALKLALESAATPLQLCTTIKSLKLQVSFLDKPRNECDECKFLLLWAYGMLTYVPSMGLLMPGTTDAMVRINAIALSVQGVEVQAVGFGSATDVTTNMVFYSERRAVFIALAEALKALATDLKKQADEQCKANEALPLTDSLRFRCGEAP